jgi:hypothetical protein
MCSTEPENKFFAKAKQYTHGLFIFQLRNIEQISDTFATMFI